MGNQLEMFSSSSVKNIDTTKGTKQCIDCKEEVSLKNFGVDRYKVGGEVTLRNQCNSCTQKQAKLLSKLKKENIKPDKNYKCPICSDNYDTIKVKSGMKDWVLDHDHLTGEFRGWLCNKCNSALGWFKDDPKIISKALDYLKEHNNGT